MYRAYWAIPRTLKTSSGEQSNAVFGMASMLLTILSKEEPDGLLICFDEGDETFRHEEAEDYKAGRAETPDDFYEQIPRIMDLLDACSLHYVSNPKYEADDLLCTYAKAGEKAGANVTVVTGDRDLLQIVSDHVQMALPHKGYQRTEYLDPKGVEEKYGIRPDQVPSYKGLCGDQSDNLPGVKGIGPKTAASLIQRYDSLENIYEHLDDIRPSVREKLERDREKAFFCERMAELVCDIPLSVKLKDIALRDIPAEPISTFFKEMEFTLLLKRFQQFLQTEYGKNHFTIPEGALLPLSPSKEDQLSLFEKA